MKELKESDLGRVIGEYEEAFLNIPFGNSKFQIEHFIINAAHTPERAYRSIGLTMRAKIQALKEAYYNLRKDDIDLSELRHKMAQKEISVSEWDRARYALEIERKEDARSDIKKLINDALAELAVLYSAMKKFPAYTREQFEVGEKRHFQIRLTKQAMGLNGPLESLDNMGLRYEPGSVDWTKPVEMEAKLTQKLKLLE